jgi:hypothetical protein
LQIKLVSEPTQIAVRCRRAPLYSVQCPPAGILLHELEREMVVVKKRETTLQQYGNW